MKDFIKKQGAATWVALATAVLALVSIIFYGVTINTGDGIRPEAQAEPTIIASEFGAITTFGVLGLIFVVITLVGAQFRFEEILANIPFGNIIGKVCDIIVDAFRLIAPALFMLLIIGMVEKTYNGISWSLFSNEELAVNPEGVTVAINIIVTAVLFLVTSIVGMVGAFFSFGKKKA